MHRKEITDIDAEIDRLTFEAGRLEEAVRGAPRAPAPEWGKLLVAVDGSSASDAALAWTSALAEALRAQVAVITVLPPRMAIDA